MVTKAGIRVAQAVVPTHFDPVMVTATIANGASLSGALDLKSGRVVALAMPAAWTAAVVTFVVSVDAGATYQDLYDQYGAEVSLTVTQGKTLQLDPAMFLGFTLLKVRSGTSAAAVNQAASRDLVLVTVG